MPIVSVITPIYNGEQFLQIAIDSLLAQTHADWEWIAVDDGSTDSTPAILSRCSDARIRIIHQENRGEAAARNTGLVNATGDYIAFLDADDLYLPNALKDLVNFMDQHQEYGVAFSDGYLCDEQGNALSRLTEHRPGIHTGHILEPLVLRASVITVPICTLTRRSAIEKWKISFDRNLVIGPDWDFWIQLAKVVQFGYLDKITCMYRIHETNITRTSGQQRRQHDLILGRLKVMNSSWFDELSVATRKEFFFTLLTQLMSGQIEQQKNVVKSRAFQSMPTYERAELFRHISVDIILKSNNSNQAKEFLIQGNRLNPDSQKTKFVLGILKINSLIAVIIVKMYIACHNLLVALKKIRNPGPKPIPSKLRPEGN